jgi:hypothetical protein
MDFREFSLQHHLCATRPAKHCLPRAYCDERKGYKDAQNGANGTEIEVAVQLRAK